MAPYVPEEVDVFSVPHSRMKALVDDYSQMLRTTNFSNDVDHQLLLESLYRTFVEFKTHEQIENRFIMRRLKAKLKRLSIQDSAVCNCHKDNVLLDMLGFIKDGFQKKTEQDRINYGRRLKELLESFTHSFLPHMKEEEEVFQPLLLQHFSYEELCELKQNVINQHIMRKSTSEGNDKLEKWVSEDSREDSASEAEEEGKPDASFSDIPPEISLKIFGYLGPKDLCRAAQVTREWNSFCLEPCLWSRILPVQWAHGLWTFEEQTSPDMDDAASDLKEDLVIDDDADVDESANDSRMIKLRHEAKILHGVCHHLAPRVGPGVQIIKLSRSKSLSTSLTQKLLKNCPNVQHLDLSYTKVSDLAFKSASRGHGLSQLQHLDLSGCKFITDTVLMHLAMALACNSHSSLLQQIQQSDDTCLCQDFYALCEQVLNVRLSAMDKNRNDEVCNTCCGQDEEYAQWDTVEDCLPRSSRRKNGRSRRWPLGSLNFSGCFQITDIGLTALALSGFFPFLSHLDLSGCFRLTADGLNTFVDRCPALLPCDLYYCDNITGGPFEDQASGCQNLECSSRACCRSGE